MTFRDTKIQYTIIHNIIPATNGFTLLKLKALMPAPFAYKMDNLVNSFIYCESVSWFNWWRKNYKNLIIDKKYTLCVIFCEENIQCALNGPFLLKNIPCMLTRGEINNLSGTNISHKYTLPMS